MHSGTSPHLEIEHAILPTKAHCPLHHTQGGRVGKMQRQRHALRNHIDRQRRRG